MKELTKLNKTPSKFKDFEFAPGTVQLTKDATGDVYIEGYANTKQKDRVGDVMLPTAFTKSLPTYQDNPVLLYQHDWDKICGSVPISKIDDNGLWIRAKISNANDCADIKTKVKEGTLRTFSIGYNELEANFDEKTQTNVVSEVELLEISIVTIPANVEAKFRPVEQVDGGEKSVSLVLSEQVVALIEAESKVSKLAELFNNVLKGEQSMKTTQANPAQADGSKAEPKPGAEAPAAGAPAAEGKPQGMDELCQHMKSMGEEIKAMHETMKGIASAMKSSEDAEPKSVSEMTDAEVEAALAAEAAQLADMNVSATA